MLVRRTRSSRSEFLRDIWLCRRPHFGWAIQEEIGLGRQPPADAWQPWQEDLPTSLWDWAKVLLGWPSQTPPNPFQVGQGGGSVGRTCYPTLIAYLFLNMPGFSAKWIRNDLDMHIRCMLCRCLGRERQKQGAPTAGTSGADQFLLTLERSLDQS